MTTSVYPTYRAIGRPITIIGLKGRYILLAAAGILADLLLFVLLYCCGTPPWLCILLAFGLGAGTIGVTRALSRRFGDQGLSKWLAVKRLPRAVRFTSRRIYLNLINV